MIAMFWNVSLFSLVVLQQESTKPHGVTSQNTALFIVAAVKKLKTIKSNDKAVLAGCTIPRVVVICYLRFGKPSPETSVRNYF
jgi:hypothetical protein